MGLACEGGGIRALYCSPLYPKGMKGGGIRAQWTLSFLRTKIDYHVKIKTKFYIEDKLIKLVATFFT